MDSVNTSEYRTKIDKKIIKIKQELDEINAQSEDKWKEHPIRVNHRIIKLQADKERLQAELRFMCRKLIMLSDEIIKALRNEREHGVSVTNNTWQLNFSMSSKY
ncbi:hypothetical protein evm_007757 [Chilo suppressalis]|nr:hypothetical protein evm_007757 [Chilo suppressalis]